MLEINNLPGGGGVGGGGLIEDLLSTFPVLAGCLSHEPSLVTLTPVTPLSLSGGASEPKGHRFDSC